MAVDQVKRLYESMPSKLDAARRRFGRPLTLAEKILVAHCWDFDSQVWERGKAILRLRVDRVALQDVTGQMALFQFMMSGRKRVAVPSIEYRRKLHGILSIWTGAPVPSPAAETEAAWQSAAEAWQIWWAANGR